MSAEPRAHRALATAATIAAIAIVASGCSAGRAASGAAASSGSSAATTAPPAPSASGAAPASSAPPASSPATVGADRYPLTGLPAGSRPVTSPALTVKIDNVAGSFPQSGLNQADVVVDTPVEGGLTRLFAVFQSQLPAMVGPVRSARPVDGDLLRLLNGGYFAYSGANNLEIAPVKANSTAVLMSFDADPSLFINRHDRPVPHEVFAVPSTLFAYGQQVKPAMAPPPPLFTYGSTPSGGVPTSGLVVHFSAATASWQWSDGRYLRTQDGRADMLADGGQVSATNVVVMSVGLRDSGIRDSAHSVEPWPVVIGSGDCWVLRDGVRVAGRWSRASLTAPMVLRDTSGATIALAPGRTWVELAPAGSAPSFTP